MSKVYILFEGRASQVYNIREKLVLETGLQWRERMDR